MIFITAKFPVKPEHADRWMDVVGEFTRATRALNPRLPPAVIAVLLGPCLPLRLLIA